MQGTAPGPSQAMPPPVGWPLPDPGAVLQAVPPGGTAESAPRVCARIGVVVMPESDTFTPGSPPVPLSRCLDTVVMLTMGSHITGANMLVDAAGDAALDHTFARLPAASKYVNQAHWTHEDAAQNPALHNFLLSQGIRYPEDKADEAYLVKSHAILWVYATHQEGALLPEDPYRGDGAKRAYLIGSSPVELLPLLSDLSHQRDHVVECMHNFSGTKARCTFHCSTPDAARASHALLSSMLQDGRAVPSVMGQLDSVQRLVHLQQGLVRAYCLDQMQKGHMTLADEMGPQLLSIGTFMQLYGASVCFSDVSAIVRQRVVEFPFELVMVFAFAAMNGLCLDPARFALSASAADKTRFFKAILTSLIIDAKQSEYYSDYAIWGVERATKEDAAINKQPGAQDPTAQGERWNYKPDHAGGYVRVRLRMTEDQRQVCTGELLHNRIIADDCETSASALMGVLKTTMVLRAYLDKAGVTSGIQRLKSRPEPNQAWPSEACCLPEVGEAVRRLFSPRLFPDGDKDHGLGLLLVCLSEALSTMSYEMDLAIGSANAAAVGAAPQLCGHCYCLLKATDLSDGLQTETVHVVEGTNWTRQHRPGDHGPGEEEQFNRMSIVASALMELTKSPDRAAQEDIGKGGVDMALGSFYKNIFVYGDSIQMRYAESENERQHCGTFVFGIPTHTLTRGVSYNRAIPVGYHLVCRHLQEMGEHIEPQDVCDMVRRLGREEAVPPWGESMWNTVLDSMYPCSRTLYDGREGVEAFDAQRHVRICMTHEFQGKDPEAAALRSFRESIEGILLHGNPPGITQRHADRLSEPFKEIKEGFPQPPLLKLDVRQANKCVEGIQRFVHLERAFTCMQALVTVCYIRKDQLQTTLSMLTSWIHAIQSAQEARLNALSHESMHHPEGLRPEYAPYPSAPG